MKDSDETVTWDDVVLQMAVDTGKTAEHPSVAGAIEALRDTKLRPSYVLDTWRRVAQSASSVEDR